MALSTASPLETLPQLVLDRICEYLNNDSEERRSLWAFSLTSRCCCAAAAAQRFCQIPLRIPPRGELESGLRRWIEVLNLNDRYRHVRRLKVLRAVTEEERRKDDLQRRGKEAQDDDEEDKSDWNTRLNFEMHDFCRPSKVSRDYTERDTMSHHPKAWLPLARFIGQMPALKDLVWACWSQIPQSVLSAVSARGCRLHMHYFRLGSLIQSRDSPQPIDPDEYVLATSPSLFSIAVSLHGFETDGMINYTEDAVKCMIAGAAPSLAHVWLYRTSAGDSLPHREAVRLGKPAWGGFFPGSVEANDLPVLGKLQTLVTTGYESYDIYQWGYYTDFTTLRCLIVSWNTGCSIALADMAMRGDFKSLDTLGLSAIEDESDQAQEALKRLLENLNPLQRLHLCGYISNEAFHIVLRRHGASLRNLSVFSYRDDESQNPRVIFSETVVQRLVEQCPNLEQIWLHIDRTRGDHRETGIYRALSRLPRLSCAFLRLWYTVGPDEEYWDEETAGPHPLAGSFFNPEEVPFAFLREAFSNSAIDATLALSIFNLISSGGGSLRYLRLETSRKMSVNAPGGGVGPFYYILRWFSRSWACKRDARGRVTVREFNKEETAYGGEEWQYLSEERQYNGEEIFQEVFHDIWPRKTPEWWKDWKSLPLSSEGA